MPCQTIDRLTLLATNGKAFTLKAGELPRGRGDGQPVRLLAEMANEDDVTALFLAVEGAKYLIASNTGRGFIVPAAELLARKAHRQAGADPEAGRGSVAVVPADGDHVAVIGENRHLLVFPAGPVAGKAGARA